MSGDNAQYRRMMRQACDNVLAAGIVTVSTSGNMRMFQGFAPIPYNAGAPGSCPSPWLHPDQMVNPGGVSNVICVGSTENNDQISAFSSPGPCTWADIPEYGDYPYTPGSTEQIGLIKPDVCAPGGNVVSLDFNTIDGYKADLGTSFAAPCVTGTIALMLSKNPELLPADICRILEETSVKLTPTKSNITGVGRVDALAAVNAVEGNDAVEENKVEARVFPNPASDRITIECEGMTQVKIFSVDGKLVKSLQVNGSECQIEGLLSGVYLVRIVSEKGIAVRRVVKL